MTDALTGGPEISLQVAPIKAVEANQERPSVFRSRAREEAGGRAALRPIDGEPRPSDPEWLRRAAHGGLAASEASPLIGRLLRLYPFSAIEK